MGSIDDSRAAAARLRQQYAEKIGQLQQVSQSISAAQQELRGRLGSTSHPKVLEAEGRCREAQQKLGQAIQMLTAASESVNQFSAGLQ